LFLSNISSYENLKLQFGLFLVQAKSKAEEAASGVTTGMILSLRERYFSVQLVWNVEY